MAVNLPSRLSIARHWMLGGDKGKLFRKLDWAEVGCFACGCVFGASTLDRTKSLERRWLTSKLDRCHIIPRSAGGANTVDNIVLLCKPCHAAAPMVGVSSRPMIDWINRRESHVNKWFHGALVEVLAVDPFLPDRFAALGLSPDDFLSRLRQAISELKLGYHPGGDVASTVAVALKMAADLDAAAVGLSRALFPGDYVFMRKLKAAIYARVSSEDQNYEMQLTEVRQYADRMGWEVVEYAEKMSAVKKRPVLDKLMDDARLKKIDVVLVWKLDRFGRSLANLIGNILLLDGYGVRFVAVTQGIDTDTKNPTSRLMIHILGAVAEFERSMIVDRVRSGMAEAKRKGKHCGRPVKIWRRDHAAEMLAGGMSFRQVGAKLGIPESTIRRTLKSAPKGF